MISSFWVVRTKYEFINESQAVGGCKVMAGGGTKKNKTVAGEGQETSRIKPAMNVSLKSRKLDARCSLLSASNAAQHARK